MTNTKYGKILAIATAICIILLGLAFIICCTHLYFTGGDNPFSRESVGRYLVILAVPSFITIAIAIAGLVFAYVNKTKDHELAKRTNLEILESFKSRFVFDSFDEETKANVLALKKQRDAVSIVAIAVSAICAVIALVYFFFIGDFSNANHNREIISALALLLPMTAVASAIHVIKLYVVEKCAKEEYDLLRASVKKNGISPMAKEIRAEKFISGVNITKCVILAVAVVFVLLGIFNGGVADVLAKAVKICTECIGLG
jgi:hypothetical protein